MCKCCQCVNVANCQYQCCQLETGNRDWQQWQHFSPFRDACNAGVFVYRFRRFSRPPSGRARRVADKRRAADGLPSKPARRDGRQSPQGDRPRRRLSWSRASAQCGRDVRSPRFLPAAALAKAVAAVSRAALVKSQLSKINVPSPLVRKSRSYCHFVRFTVLLERDFTQCLSAPKNILTFFSAW